MEPEGIEPPVARRRLVYSQVGTIPRRLQTNEKGVSVSRDALVVAGLRVRASYEGVLGFSWFLCA